MSARPTCALCEQREAVGQGEHVIPQWFLREFFSQADGPFSTEKSGMPDTDRDGHLRKQSSFRRSFLDCCTPCNQHLNTFFEEPCRDSVTQFYEGELVTDPDSLVRWLLKTALLYNHPKLFEREAEGKQVYVNQNRQDIHPDLLNWIFSNPGDPIPRWISIWVAKELRVSSPPKSILGQPSVEPHGEPIDLYDFPIAGKRYYPSVNRLRFAGKNDLFLVDVVYHPGCEITHPFEDHRGLVQLQPSPPRQQINMSEIPSLTRDEKEQWEAVWGRPYRLYSFRDDFNPLETPWTLNNSTNYQCFPPSCTGGAIGLDLF